jgi:hypothetical protein
MTRLDEVRAMTREQLEEALERAETSAGHNKFKRREAEREVKRLREALRSAAALIPHDGICTSTVADDDGEYICNCWRGKNEEIKKIEQALGPEKEGT